MSNDDPMAAGFAPWMRMWFEMASAAMEACQTWAGATASPEPVRQMRSAMLQSWSDYWDKFLRSSLFLDATKQAMAQSTEFRKQLREYLDRIYSESPFAGREDMDRVLRAVRRTEYRLLEQIEDLSARLDELAARVNGDRETDEKPARPENRSRRKPNRTGQHDREPQLSPEEE